MTMKKKILIFSVLTILASIAIFGNHAPYALADSFSLRTILNYVSSTLSTNATSTVSVLRYVDNGATTTLPTDASSGTNQNGFVITDMENITLKYQTIGSSTYSARFDVEYGYDIPLNSGTNETSIQWFRHNIEVAGPAVARIASTSNMQDSYLATSTPPAIIRSNLGTATTSEIINLPTFNAKYMRVRAAPYGSSAMFWMSVDIRPRR